MHAFATCCVSFTAIMEKRTDFIRTDKPEIHAFRRKAILQKYPEIQKLYVKDPMSAVFCLFTMLFQIVMVGVVYHFDFSWWILVPLTWVVSGSFQHSLTLSNHELSHSLWFPKVIHNEIFAICTNFITGFPSAMTFKHYHLEHHTNQGINGVDVDLPTTFEGKYINNVLTKFAFLALQPFVYSFRPMIVRPKQMNTMEMINWVTTVISDVCVFYFLGGKCLFYLMGGSVLGTSLHPLAGHFIAEHYVFDKEQETYSTYDKFWNWFVYQVGYHNEHHDFPRVPGRLLPKVKEIAPEYYDSLVSYDSWSQTLINWVIQPQVGCFNRVMRPGIGSREEIEAASKEYQAAVDKWAKEHGVEVKADAKQTPVDEVSTEGSESEKEDVRQRKPVTAN